MPNEVSTIKIQKKNIKEKIYEGLCRIPFVLDILPFITRRLDRKKAYWIVCRIPPRYSHIDKVMTFYGVKMKIFTGESMGRIMYFFNDWEPKQNDFFAAYIKPGMLFFDIGANMGFYSLYAAKHGARAIAFEPDVEIAKNYLEFNLELNKVAGKITVVNEAVSSAPGTTKFYLHRPGSWGAGRIFKFVDAKNSFESHGEIEVKTDTIDNYTAKYGQPDVIKIDIEGAEYFALAGAEKTLRREEAPLLMIEFHPGEIIQASGGQSSYKKLIAELLAYGYKEYKVFERNEQNPTWYVFSKTEIPAEVRATFTNK